MGSPEDLEEYESELELALKREFQTVYPLFTYCVVVQGATYLCNQLEIQHAAAEGAIMFDISMEDVWVWDHNRPTRIIPAAQVFTTSDLSIEQLREADDGDRLADIVPDDIIEQLAASGGLPTIDVELDSLAGEDDAQPGDDGPAASDGDSSAGGDAPQAGS